MSRRSRPPGAPHGPEIQLRALPVEAGRRAGRRVGATRTPCRRGACLQGLLATDPACCPPDTAGPAFGSPKTQVARPAEQIWPGRTKDPTGRGTVTRPPLKGGALLEYLRVTVEVSPSRGMGIPPHSRYVHAFVVSQH